MNIVQPSFEIVECPEDALKRIERAARTCYKTEDRIDEGSAEKLVRHLVSRRHFAMLEFGGVLWVRFISNRGFTHEQVRHRLASYAQESTRYCNYARDKFGNEVSFIDSGSIVPKWWTADQIELWLLANDAVSRFTEEWYLKLIDEGIPAQFAREVLPISLKTEINVQANFVEWRHIFEQRTSPAAHPRMIELLVPLLYAVAERVPIIFDDLVERLESGR